MILQLLTDGDGHDRCHDSAEAARDRLQKSPYRTIRQLVCECHEGVLFLRGRLPTFHLKQVAQETVAKMEGISQVVNMTVVDDQKLRILTALGWTDDRLPVVEDETVHRYYECLSEDLVFPFAVHYPEPVTLLEQLLYECAVLGLLDPSKGISDAFDGIFCKTQKEKFEANLPLVELEVPHDSSNAQMIEDYRFWFWNWR